MTTQNGALGVRQIADWEHWKELLRKAGVSDPRPYRNAANAVKRIKEIYDKSIRRLREGVRMLGNGASLEQVDRDNRYPVILFHIPKGELNVDTTAVYGFCRNGPGWYHLSVTRPDLFSEYWEEQIDLVMQAHNQPVIIGKGPLDIPLEAALPPGSVESSIAMHFPDMNPVRIEAGNELVINGTPAYPLLEFNGMWVDYALARQSYYNGVDAKHTQRFVLLTNYKMYFERFVEWGRQQVAKRGSGYREVILPEALQEGSVSTKLPQMPVCHVTRKDGNGITMIDIGVGPSNAWNIVAKLCVHRPHVVLMVGHCGGLRATQRLGAFVLADNYYRDDGILDEIVDQRIPITPVLEVNTALRKAVAKVCGVEGEELKAILESGPLATTAERDWEINALRRQQIVDSRALAVDMESATIAAACFKYRVPFGTLLRISDIPLHGKLKLEGAARQFYEESVGSHLEAAITAVEIMRKEGPEKLQSRKIQASDSPAFR